MTAFAHRGIIDDVTWVEGQEASNLKLLARHDHVHRIESGECLKRRDGAPCAIEEEERSTRGPRHGARGICRACGRGIEFIEYTAWNGWAHDVLDSWWAHDVHPDDEHDAEPS